MEYMWCFTFLSFVTTVLADYYVDNANTSVIYSMPPSLTGPGWQTFSITTQALQLQISNSTGNYTILLDASNCYDQNYALGVCGTADNCFVEMPFIGSGITMYVFNAGFSGMAASFSVDGGAAISSTIDKPPPPNYQVSNVSLYNIQGLPSGNHTMKMTLLDWQGGGTSMKFDYALVNETFVALPTTTPSASSMTSTSASHTSSQTTPTGNSSSSNSSNIGGIVGATLGGLALLVGLLIGGFFCWRRRGEARRGITASGPNLEASPFTSEFGSPTPPPVLFAHRNLFSAQHREEIAPHTRSAILRDAHTHTTGSYPSSGLDPTSLSIRSGQSSGGLQPLRRPPSQSEEVDVHPAPSSASYIADTSRISPFSDPQLTSRYNLTAEQGEVIRQLQRDNVPVETVARVVEGYVSSNFATGGKLTRERSIVSTAPPPSYQTRDG